MNWNAKSEIKIPVRPGVTWGQVADAVKSVTELTGVPLSPFKEQTTPSYAAWGNDGELVVRIDREADENFIATFVEPLATRLNEIASEPFEVAVHDFKSIWNNEVVFKAIGGPSQPLRLDLPYEPAEVADAPRG